MPNRPNPKTPKNPSLFGAPSGDLRRLAPPPGTCGGLLAALVGASAARCARLRLSGAQLALIAIAFTASSVTLGQTMPPNLANSAWQVVCQKQPDSKLFFKGFLTFGELNFSLNGSTYSDSDCKRHETDFVLSGEYEVARPLAEGTELDLNTKLPEVDPRYHLAKLVSVAGAADELHVTAGSEEHVNRPNNFDGVEKLIWKRLH